MVSRPRSSWPAALAACNAERIAGESTTLGTTTSEPDQSWTFAVASATRTSSHRGSDSIARGRRRLAGTLPLARVEGIAVAVSVPYRSGQRGDEHRETRAITLPGAWPGGDRAC